MVENQNQKLEELYEDIDDEVGGQSSVDDILAKRGLLIQEDDDDEGDDKVKQDDDDGEVVDDPQGQGEFSIDSVKVEGEELQLDEVVDDMDETEHAHGGGNGSGVLKDGDDNSDDSIKEESSGREIIDDQGEINGGINDSDEVNTEGSKESGKGFEKNADTVSTEDIDFDVAIENVTYDAVDSGESGLKPIEDNVDLNKDVPPKPSENGISAQIQAQQNETNKALISQIESLKEALEAQKGRNKATAMEKTTSDKETRKLRRTLVKLNGELDSAERELEAQRTELERAAARIEKDRHRSKEEKERLESSHKENMKTLAEEHKTAISAMVDAHSKQMSDMEARIERAEEARAKEGGDMSAELADSVERERETLKKLRSMEEEKSSFASQVLSLNTQITGMESRIESLQQTAESAREQERDADDRLDAALTLHARQLSQRQTREAELERTIADLSAALVVARSRETNLLNNAGAKGGEGLNSTISELKDTLLNAKDEVETLNTQLLMERQKAETLQQELEDVTNERAQETSYSLDMQKDYDRRISELTSTITKLQLRQNNNLRQSSEGGPESESMSEKLEKQVANLSEDLIHQKAKLQHSSTEIQTLRNRLKSALSRAEVAEKAAQAYDVERGSPGNQMRRRYGVQSRKTVTSISSAFKLEAGRGEVKENIGKVVDTIDSIAIDTGSRFRSDPIARAFFIVYLIILHLWAFCLVIFHAHVSLEPSSGMGPEQLLKPSYSHIEQVNSP